MTRTQTEKKERKKKKNGELYRKGGGRGWELGAGRQESRLSFGGGGAAVQEDGAAVRRPGWQRVEVGESGGGKKNKFLFLFYFIWQPLPMRWGDEGEHET